MRRQAVSVGIVLIALSVIVLLNIRQKPDAKVITITDTVYSTDTVRVITQVPKPYKVIYHDTTTITHVDTAFVIKDYSSYVIYEDTLMNDSLAFISLRDTVYRNRLLNRSLTYYNRQPLIINNITPNTRYSVGVVVGQGYGITASYSVRSWDLGTIVTNKGAFITLSKRW